ncbi:MAG: hypothetical protein RLO50_14480 [Azospirillaceae bacterium]
MTSKLWSINGLATELDTDRRTIAAKLKRAPPDGRLKGHPAWHLTTALRAINGDASSRRSGDGVDLLEGRNPVDAALGLHHNVMMSGLPHWLAERLVEAGIEATDAADLGRSMAEAFDTRNRELLRDALWMPAHDVPGPASTTITGLPDIEALTALAASLDPSPSATS